MMNLGDLETIIRLWLDIVLVVLNNHSYGMIKWKQLWGGMRDFGLDFWNPDFVALAQSFGATWYKVSDKNDFKPTLETALSEKWLILLDVDFDYPEGGEIY
jgi:acetolactate synthase-1/2/3 large subunit